MKFYSFDNPPERNMSPVGSRVNPSYILKTLKDGTKTLVQNGEIDTYGLIQSHYNSCDINAIVARARQGDLSVLNVNPGVFVDLTKLPKDISEANSMLSEARAQFENLPVELRNAFDNNPDKMLSMYDNGKMPDILKNYVDTYYKKNPIQDKKENVDNVE